MSFLKSFTICISLLFALHIGFAQSLWCAQPHMTAVEKTVTPTVPQDHVIATQELPTADRRVTDGSSESSKPKAFMVTPKIGYSVYSGIYGVEIQLYRIAIAAGKFVDDKNAGGAKYYFTSEKNSFFIGNCFYYRSYPRKEYLIGGLAGYRWLLESGLNITAGGGMGQKKQSDTDGSSTSTEIIVDLAVGYTF